MDLRSLILDYYKSAQFMQLATTVDDQPWICTVTFVSDNDLNLYWVSQKNRRHSEEILQNPNTAVAIVKDLNPKQALQITGQAHVVPVDDVGSVFELYATQIGATSSLLDIIKKGLPEGPAFWKCTPTTISLWDELNFPDEPKQEYTIQ